MQIQQLLKLIPEDTLDQLALNTNVDHYSKKLQGEVVFKLLLYCLLTHKNNSLRTMESTYESIAFNLLNQRYVKGQICYNSISERLNVISPDYFQQLYETCLVSYKKS